MSDSKLTPPEGRAAMSVREARLILRRLLAAASVAPGAIVPLRDVLFDAELAGLGILTLLHQEPTLLDAMDPRPVTLAADGTTLDGGGALALAVVPAVVDLLVETCAAATSGVVEVRVAGVARPALLGAVNPAARRAGLAATVAFDPEGAVVSARWLTDEERATPDRVSVRALREGIWVDGTVWLDLYLRSNRALLPDSAETRQHAGYGDDVDDQGRIVKPMDDDVDVELALAEFQAGGQSETVV